MARRTRNTPVSSFSLDRTLQEFLIDRQARNLARKTLQWYEHSLAIFRAFLVEQQIETVHSITPHHLRYFLLYLTERGHNADGIQGGQHEEQETVAEFTACVLAALYGADYSGNAWHSIQGYAKDPLSAIHKALSTVEKVLALILCEPIPLSCDPICANR